MADVVARLRADPAFAEHADVLDAALRAPADATLRLERVPALEDAARAREGHGTGWATVATYVEPDGDPEALRAAYLDYDRVAEWTGKASARRVEDRGDVVVGRTDAIRTAFGVRYGARWRFEARRVDVGAARALAVRQVPDPTTEGMRTTHGVLLVVPEAGGTRVVECAASVLDYEVPALLRNLAAGAALQEMRARIEGVRGHWREYRGRR